MYQIRYTIFNPLTRQYSPEISFPRNGLMERSQIVPAMQQTTDAVMFELLYDKPATAADLQKIQKASKKPLFTAFFAFPWSRSTLLMMFVWLPMA